MLITLQGCILAESLKLFLRGLHERQCNAEIGIQSTICFKTEENDEKCGSIWPVARPSGCILTSKKQSGVRLQKTSPQSLHLLLFYF
jgi:hypothetical protein